MHPEAKNNVLIPVHTPHILQQLSTCRHTRARAHAHTSLTYFSIELAQVRDCTVLHGSRDLTKNHVIRPPGGEALMTYGMIRHQICAQWSLLLPTGPELNAIV